MRYGVKKSPTFGKWKSGILAFLCLICFSKVAAQSLQRGGLKSATDTLKTQPQDGEFPDSLIQRGAVKEDSIEVIELTYKERFNSIRFVKDINWLNYHPLDTQLKYFHQYNPANKFEFSHLHLGTLGSPTYSILPVFNNSLRFNLGLNQFKPYQFSPDSIAIFNLNAPYTFINWVFGTKDQQYFDVQHANRIKDLVQFGIRLRRLSETGYYSRQKTGHSDFSAYTSYETKNKRYRNIFTMVNSKYLYQQNGGIKEDSVNWVFDIDTLQRPNSEVFRREVVPIYLTNAVSRENKWNFALNQYYNVGKYFNEPLTDTTSVKRFVPVLRLKHRIELNNSHYVYEDSGNDEFSFYPDSLIHQKGYYVDSIKQRTWHNELALIQTGKSASNLRATALPVKSYLGLHFENIKIKQQYNTDTVSINNAWLQFKASDTNTSNFKYDINLEYGLFKNSYQHTNYKLNGQLSYEISDIFGEFGIGYLLNKYTTPYIYTNYSSNFYSWKNQNFEPIAVNQVSLFYKNNRLKFKAAYQQIDFNNVIVIDTIRPIIGDTTDNTATNYKSTKGKLHRISLYKTVNIGWWQMRHQLNFQTTANDYLFIPNVIYQGSFYYSDYLFKRALNFNIGVDVQYTSNFKLPAYQPVTGQFFAQTKHSYQFYPRFDFFINFKIKTATFFFKIEYLNQGIFQRGYYGAYNYPQGDIAFRGGIAWRFFD